MTLQQHFFALVFPSGHPRSCNRKSLWSPKTAVTWRQLQPMFSFYSFKQGARPYTRGDFWGHWPAPNRRLCLPLKYSPGLKTDADSPVRLTHMLSTHPSAVGGRSPAAPWRLPPAPAAWGGCRAGSRRWADDKTEEETSARGPFNDFRGLLQLHQGWHVSLSQVKCSSL